MDILSVSLFLIAKVTIVIYFFLFSFTSLSSFFTHIETDQSVGGAKTGVPGGKPPDTPASRTWLVPHVTRATHYSYVLLYKTARRCPSTENIIIIEFEHT